MRGHLILEFIGACLLLHSLSFASALFNSSQQCKTDVQEQQASLIDFYQVTGGPSWTNMSGWLDLSISCSAKNDSGIFVPLPSQCCWHGVDCCYQAACSADTSLV
jgi:hypothetical protein